MSGEQEVCTVSEQESEPEVTCSEDPSKGSEAKVKRSHYSRSSRAGLLFPVSRVDRQLRSGHFAKRLGAEAPVYLAAVLQCVTHETVDEAAKISKEEKQQRISPLHLKMAVQKSSVLKKLMRGSRLRKRGKSGPQSRRPASRSRKETTKGTKRCPRQRAAPAPATAVVN